MDILSFINYETYLIAPYRSTLNRIHLVKNSDIIKSNSKLSTMFDRFSSKYIRRNNEKQTLNLSRYLLVKIF